MWPRRSVLFSPYSMVINDMIQNSSRLIPPNESMVDTNFRFYCDCWRLNMYIYDVLSNYMCITTVIVSAERTLSGHDESVDALPYRCM